MLDKRKFYINGQWVDSSKKNDFEVINPSDESVCALISLGSQADTDAAVSAARAALPMWSNSSKEDRIALLESLYSIYQRRMDEMAELISMEMGAPIDFAKRSQAPSGTEAIEDFLNQLKKFEFEKQLDDTDNQLIYQPKGVLCTHYPMELANKPGCAQGNSCYCSWLHNGSKAIRNCPSGFNVVR